MHPSNQNDEPNFCTWHYTPGKLTLEPPKKLVVWVDVFPVSKHRIEVRSWKIGATEALVMLKPLLNVPGNIFWYPLTDVMEWKVLDVFWYPEKDMEKSWFSLRCHSSMRDLHGTSYASWTLLKKTRENFHGALHHLHVSLSHSIIKRWWCNTLSCGQVAWTTLAVGVSDINPVAA